MEKWIEWLYDDDFEIIFKRIGKELWEDLRQEICIIVLEYDQHKIDELIQKGKPVFKFWIVRVCMNQVSKNGKLNKTYNVLIPVEDINKFIKKDIQINIDIEFIKQIYNQIDKLYWYDKEILKLYIELGSVRKVSVHTGIPHTSIFITIKNIQRCIKQSLEY
jgi:hypothetical protein